MPKLRGFNDLVTIIDEDTLETMDISATGQTKTCRHCKLGPQHHVKNGETLKCAFEATNYEPMTAEEGIKFIGEIMKSWHQK